MPLQLQNTELRKAISKEKYGPEDIKEIITAIIDADLYIPIHVISGALIEEADGFKDIQETRDCSLPCIKHEEHGYMLPIFTNGDEFNEFNSRHKDNTYVPYVITFRNLAAFVEDRTEYDGFLLDPYGTSLPFTKEILYSIKKVLE